MSQKNISVLKISPNDMDDYVICDDVARDLANTAKSTADTAKSTANTAKSTADTAKSTANTAKSTADSKLKTATLQSQYTEETKTLTLNIQTSTS